MRSTGIVIILALFGIASWMAFYRNLEAEASAEISRSETSSISTRRSPQKPARSKPSSILADQVTLQVEVAEPAVLSMPEPEVVIPKKTLKEVDRPPIRPQPDLEFDRLAIPTLKVNTSVRSKPYAELTWDLSDLGHDIAFLEDVPGQETSYNLIFAGHVTVRNGSNGPFRYLRKLVPGDKILLYKGEQIFTYTVIEQQLVYPDDTSVLADTPQPQVTLITCNTWDEETLSYLRRLIITAQLEKIEIDQINFD